MLLASISKTLNSNHSREYFCELHFRGAVYTGIWGGSNSVLNMWIKVSATLRDRLRADRSSFCWFYKKPYKLYIFGSLIIPENDFIFKKRHKFNMFGKREGFFTHTCLHRLRSTHSRNKENKTILFLTPMAKKPCLRFLTSAFVLLF